MDILPCMYYVRSKQLARAVDIDAVRTLQLASEVQMVPTSSMEVVPFAWK